jgi:hypothetical protein
VTQFAFFAGHQAPGAVTEPVASVTGFHAHTKSLVLPVRILSVAVGAPYAILEMNVVPKNEAGYAKVVQIYPMAANTLGNLNFVPFIAGAKLGFARKDSDSQNKHKSQYGDRQNYQ